MLSVCCIYVIFCDWKGKVKNAKLEEIKDLRMAQVTLGLLGTKEPYCQRIEALVRWVEGSRRGIESVLFGLHQALRSQHVGHGQGPCASLGRAGLGGQAIMWG